MIHAEHRAVEIVLERAHSQLHARELHVDRIGANLNCAECVFKDDGAQPSGIPPIPYSFQFADNENWDELLGRIWRFLESEKRRLVHTIQL